MQMQKPGFIRPAELIDAQDMALLPGESGYPTDKRRVAVRMKLLLSRDDDRKTVAERHACSAGVICTSIRHQRLQQRSDTRRSGPNPPLIGLGLLRLKKPARCFH